jgi:hypothetical protein
MTLTLQPIETPSELARLCRKASFDLWVKAQVRHGTIARLLADFADKPQLYAAYSAVNGSPEPVGFVVLRISQDAPNHAVLELAWVSKEYRLTPDDMGALDTEIWNWAADNEIASLTAVTPRDGKAMDGLLAYLGMFPVGSLYGRTFDRGTGE